MMQVAKRTPTTTALPFIHPILPSSGLSLAIMRGESSANRLVKLERSATVHGPRSHPLTKTLRLPVFAAVMKSGRLPSLCFSAVVWSCSPLRGLTTLSANRNSSAGCFTENSKVWRDVWLLPTHTHAQIDTLFSSAFWFASRKVSMKLLLKGFLIYFC